MRRCSSSSRTCSARRYSTRARTLRRSSSTWASHARTWSDPMPDPGAPTGTRDTGTRGDPLRRNAGEITAF